MIQLPNQKLSNYAIAQLKKYYQKVLNQTSFKAKVVEAKRIWDNASKTNKTFLEIKEKLTEMCSGSQRCCYCEDAPADEIEHIAPKNIYPLLCFSWSNYLYACGICNGPKNNKFAVFLKSNEAFKDITPPKGKCPVPPKGSPVLINPRKENPLDFLFLDLKNTFHFVPLPDDKTSKAYKRAEYTICVLRLNKRDSLVSSRRTAFGSYEARLKTYITEKQSGKTEIKLQKMIEGIQTERHVTVFKEMQRQYVLFGFFKDLFDPIPEALNW